MTDCIKHVHCIFISLPLSSLSSLSLLLLLFSLLGSYQRSISEDAAGDSSIVRVSARDADSGTNAVIEYLITDVQTVGVVVSTDEQVHNNELGVGGCQGFYPSHTNLHKFASK